MNSTEEEVGNTSLFAGSVASDDRQLAIDEDVSVSSFVPSSHFVPDSNVVVKEREECVRRALEEVAASDSRAEEASEEESFVDIMGSFEKETGGESEEFTFADILQREVFLSETVHCVPFIVHYPLIFIYRKAVVATHFFYKLVFSARLFIMMASWGFLCFSV